MGDTSFTVDLDALAAAITQVSGERDAIQGGIASMKATFRKVEDHWQSPAGTSLVTLTTHFNTVTDTMMSVLDEAISRMTTAHQNYASTEQTNTANYQAKTTTSGPGTTAAPPPDTTAAPPPDTTAAPDTTQLSRVEGRAGLIPNLARSTGRLA